MKEYIERELLLIGVDGCISSLHAQAKGEPIQEAAIKLVETTRDYIASISAADVVEVVRCGECRHAEDSLVLWCTEHEQAVSRLDFCSHGARMDKEDEHEAD